MAALSTAIADIFEPSIWSPAFIELTTTKSLLVQSGIANAPQDVVDAAMKGGRTVDMPFWDDLVNSDSVASSVATDTDTSITATGITSDYDIAVKHFRTKAWNVSPVVKYVAGEDPVQTALSRYANWWVREEQRLLLKTLSGVFADATVAAALGNDISDEVSTSDPAYLISSSAVEDTRFLLGDAYDKFTAIIMHSVPFKRLRNLGLIDFVPVDQQNPMAGQRPTYMGLNVLVDDSMTKTAGSTSGYKYDTFLFGQGAFARVDVPLEGEDTNIEVYREPLKGTGWGSTNVITRRAFILHPRGIKYVGSLSGVVSPSDSDLSTDNWTQVYQTKNIRIARLRTNG